MTSCQVRLHTDNSLLTPSSKYSCLVFRRFAYFTMLPRKHREMVSPPIKEVLSNKTQAWDMMVQEAHGPTR